MLFNVAGAILDSFLLYLMLHNQLTFNEKFKNHRIPVYATCVILLTRCALCSDIKGTYIDYISKIICVFLIFCTVILIYKDPFKKKFLYVLLFYMIMIISELVILCVLILVSGGKPFIMVMQSTLLVQICTIFTKSISFCIIEELHLRLKASKYMTIPYKKDLCFIMAYNLVMFFLLLYLLTTDAAYMQENSGPLLIISFSVLFISIITSMLIIEIYKRSKEELEDKLHLQQMEMQCKMSEDMSTLVEKVRYFRHDMNNHFSLMLGLLKEHDYDQLEHYITEFIQEISNVNQYIFLDNKALTIVLNNKLAKAALYNVKVDTVIEVQTLPLTDMEICGLIGNILDNAIEAACRVDDLPYLSLRLTRRGNYYLIECNNSYKVKPIKENNHFISTKGNNEIHGIGLENIKSIVDRYDGEMDITYDTMFHLSIYLADTTTKEMEA